MLLSNLFENKLAEVAMNPTAYKKSLQTGQDLGVRIGFEFECLIPKDTMVNYAVDPENVLMIATTSNLQVMNLKFLNSNISLLDSTEYENFGSAYANYIQNNKTDLVSSVERIIEGLSGKMLVFYNQDFSGSNANLDEYGLREYPDTAIAKIVQLYAMEKFLQGWTANDRFINEYEFKNLQSGRQYKGEEAIEQFSGLVRALYNHYVALQTHSSQIILRDFFRAEFNYRNDLESTADYLSYSQEIIQTIGDDISNNVDDDDDEGGYRAAAEMIQGDLRAASYNAIIFNYYHQDDKDEDTWYIEPDGSLRPDYGDFSAEVVTPPLRVNEALKALKWFYREVKLRNLYTNSSTGLHINVSIPKNVDILKLAVFLGEEHVLKSFGRENNRYVQSIVKQLKGHGTPEPITSGREAQLKRLARNYSGDHFTSVNYNEDADYFSFRHAGGSYSEMFEDIQNTIGRFVRALIIASNPEAERQEYLKKLNQMFGPQQAAASTDNIVTTLRRLGVPMIKTVVFIFNEEEATEQNVVNGVVRKFRTLGIDATEQNCGFSVVPGDDMTREQFLTATPGISSGTKDKIREGESINFYEVIVAPTDVASTGSMLMKMEELKASKKAWGLFNGGSRIGIGSFDVQAIPLGDPAASPVLRQIIDATRARRNTGGER